MTEAAVSRVHGVLGVRVEVALAALLIVLLVIVAGNV